LPGRGAYGIGYFVTDDGRVSFYTLLGGVGALAIGLNHTLTEDRKIDMPWPLFVGACFIGAALLGLVSQ
jgi:hypothetical protein